MTRLTITLHPTTITRLADLRRLYEANGRIWRGDAFMAGWLVERGLSTELEEQRFIAEIFERRPDLFALPPEGES